MDRKFKKRFLKTEINRKVDTKIFVEAYFSTYKQFNYALDEARWIERRRAKHLSRSISVLSISVSLRLM